MKKTILIAREKHGDRYFDASTDELLAKACLKLLSERLENGYYTPYKLKHCDDVLTVEEIAKLPERLQKTEMDRLKTAKQLSADYEQDVKFYEEVKRVVSEKDLTMGNKGYFAKYPKAYNLLHSRGDAEYEAIDLETLEKA